MGIVYVLTNPAMPDLVKIGRTDGPLVERVRQLSSVPGVPLPFEVFFAAEVGNSIGWERALHEAFDDRLLNARREFFRLSPDKPAAILKMLQAVNVTPVFDIVDSPEEQEALDRERQRASRFNFFQVGINPGAQLHSVFDDDITALVLDDTGVDFQGARHSLTSAALLVAHQNGYTWKTIRGPGFWKYEGKTLVEIKDEYLTGTD
jgi:hypothetical protein